MYAVIRTGGKQYTVRAGDTLRVEKIQHELGSEFAVDEVLLVGGDKIHVGEPTVKNAKVTVVVTQQAKAPKVIVFKKKRRQGYRRLKGHRQYFTELFVKAIQSPTGEVSEADKAARVIDPVASAEKKAIHEAKIVDSGADVKAAKKAKAATKKAASGAKAAKKSTGAKKKTVAKKKAAGTKKKA
jgi:large subunit ribosomal protein L21